MTKSKTCITKIFYIFGKTLEHEHKDALKTDLEIEHLEIEEINEFK